MGDLKFLVINEILIRWPMKKPKKTSLRPPSPSSEANNSFAGATLVTPENPIGFNGYPLDKISGCYILGSGYRLYNPKMRTFYSPDSWSPFGAGGVSRYQYCQLDPINYADPTGHDARLTWGFILGAVAIAVGVATLGVFLVPAITAGAVTTTVAVSTGMAVMGIAAGAGAIATGVVANYASSLGLSSEVQDQLAWASFGLGVAGVALSFGALTIAQLNPGIAASAAARTRPLAGRAGARLDAAYFRTGSEAVTFQRSNIHLLPSRVPATTVGRTARETFSQAARGYGRGPGTGFSELGSAIMSSRKFPVRLGY